ncbi:MAG TPA: cytochrome c biogenesis protein CcsA [Verrucomicrobiae bacterium]|jgi:cytochrome c-type biogenesis protein CcsB|nr:cytochrome c biogenesis protein CcsA [Verrucomicrobiae bacterium]
MKKIFQKWFPAVLMLAMTLWFFGQLQTPQDKNFAFNEFGKLPVVFDGRLKPLDSLARNSLLQLREKQTLNLEPWKGWNENPKIISADEWLANVMMNPAVADDWPVFRLDNPELITFLKLPEKNAAQHQDGKHYSWDQIQASFDALERESQRISEREASHVTESSQRTPFERAVMKVYDRAVLYTQLKNTIQPQNADNWKQELTDYENLIPSGTAAVRAQQAGQNYDTNVFNAFLGELQRFDFMSKLETPLIVPPSDSGTGFQPVPLSGDWKRVGTVLLEAAKGDKISPAVQDYAAMADAFKSGDVASFNSALADYRSLLVPDFSRAMAKSRAEVFFNQMQPFYNAMVIYVLAGLLAIFSWFNLSETLRRSAVWLIALAFAIHTTGLIYRIVLQGRPPVTNLYSSAIFIGWGAVILGIILEKFYKNGIGAVVSAGMGFITLIIAQNLALDGDTMEMMRAVLDTNFWLATHVVAVTTGYASTFVAGFLALIYVILGVFTKTLSRTPTMKDAVVIGVASPVLGAAAAISAAKEMNFGQSIARMIYGIVCFATLFSFVGTVLGGIWADQSWGRFWGWDPKENGALIIVLWNALILHLRWGGMIRERGLVVCAIGGNIVTSWSWFGVNMLGIGLHSYGFTDAAFKWLVLFVASQIGFIVLGSLPVKMWKSFQPKI